MNIFVGSSSRNIECKEFNELAEKIGNFIVEGKHNYVFGGCIRGLMGTIYEIVKNTESKIIATSVLSYSDEIECLNKDYPKAIQIVSKNVGERKNELIHNSDVMIFIPGGIGTLDELFSSIEAKRAGEHNNPIFIMNINGYYNKLVEMLDNIYKNKFASPSDSENYKICFSFEELINEINKIDI